MRVVSVCLYSVRVYYSASTGSCFGEFSMAGSGVVGEVQRQAIVCILGQVYLTGYVIATATAAMRAIKPFGFHAQWRGRAVNGWPSLTFVRRALGFFF